MKVFNLKKLNYVEVKEQYQVKISNRFPTLENFDDYDNDNDDDNDDDYVEINRVWESITAKIKASATESLKFYEMKHHKP
jgi:hypothetical protein